MTATLGLDDLAAPFPAQELPALDRPGWKPVSAAQAWWQQNGYLINRGLIPPDLIAAYRTAWLADNGPDGRFGDRPGGWPYDTPYVNVPALRDLACHPKLAQMLHHLIGEPMGVHLNLTGWRSTQRDWHQDGYLNPDHVADWYAAVWIALDTIHPDAGPFEFVPGSHRIFPPIRQTTMQEAIAEHVGPAEARAPDWPRHSEAILTPMFEDLMVEHDLERRTFCSPARAGDVLIWHARLLHRGSPPINPDLERRGVILHYSGIFHRPDMPAPRHAGEGAWWFPIDQGGHR